MTGRERWTRSFTGVGLVLPLALLLGACQPWTMFGFDAAHSGDNSSEYMIGRGNVGNLVEGATTTGVNGSSINGYISSVPTTANGMLYVTANVSSDGDGTLYAYSANGSENCTTPIPQTCTPLWTVTPAGNHQLDSSPAIDPSENIVYVGSADGVLYAYNASNGSLEWQSPPLGGSVDSSPTIANGYIYVSIVYGWTYVFPLTTGSDGVNPSCGDDTTGKMICQPQYGDLTPGDVYSSPAIANGVMYTATASGGTGRVISSGHSRRRTTAPGARESHLQSGSVRPVRNPCGQQGGTAEGRRRRSPMGWSISALFSTGYSHTRPAGPPAARARRTTE